MENNVEKSNIIALKKRGGKMIEKFCSYLTKKIGKEMPELDEERLEVINFGLQNIVGEIPKIFITIAVAFLLGIGDLTLWSILFISCNTS